MALANLISAGWRAAGSHEGALLGLHGMTIEEVLEKGETVLGSPLVEGEMEGFRYSLYEPKEDDSVPENSDSGRL